MSDFSLSQSSLDLSSFYEDVLDGRRRTSPCSTNNITPQKKSINYVNEYNISMYNAKCKHDIKIFATQNIIFILILLSTEYYIIYENLWTLWIKRIFILICICNLLYFLVKYFRLFRAQKKQNLNNKRQVKITESTDFAPEMVTLKPSIEVEDVKQSERTLSMDQSFNMSESTLIKYKNTMFSRAKDLYHYLYDYKQAQNDDVVSLSRDSSIPSGPYDFWTSENRKDTSPNSHDVSPLLRTSQYQVSISNINVKWGLDDDKIDSDFYVKWICNLRSWFSQTILKRLIKEIDLVNTSLQKEGMGNCLIGTASLDTLINTANNNNIAQKIPSINFIIPFLRVMTNQQYLVRRIRDLAEGSSMSCYNWNSGGNYNDKNWSNHLITDAELVMHLFLTYLDTRLPFSAEQPSPKPFSSKYFARGPKQPRKTNLALIQAGSVPPNYDLIVKNSYKHIPKGRNNLFYAIVQFLRLLKKNENGSLGNINWGRGGLNMIWIIENKNI